MTGLLGALVLGAALAGGGSMPPLRAAAELRDQAGTVVGQATFSPQGSGLRVQVQARGLPPGERGMHIHEYGRCAPGVDPVQNETVPFGAAGGHFDPQNSHNHATPTTDNRLGHAGDLPMLQVGADGVGRADFVTNKVALVGENGILSRTLVIHAGPDDFATDPDGGTGERLVCGVVNRQNFAARDFGLPGADTYPEGVAVRGGLIYTGSATRGDIYRVDPQSGAVELWAPGGAQGRQAALGLAFDRQGRLFVAGGAQGTVAVLRGDGFPLAVLQTPDSPNPFVNDLVQAPDGFVYVTDSSRPVIYRVGENLTIAPWLDLAQTPIRYRSGINLNGIVATADGRFLLTVQSNTGQLWRIDLRSRAASLVMDGLAGGDGLLLQEQTLYVVRNAAGVVSRVDLSADFSRGTVTGEDPANGLRFPTTVALLGGELVVPQGQLDRLEGGTPETPFRLTRLPRF